MKSLDTDICNSVMIFPKPFKTSFPSLTAASLFLAQPPLLITAGRRRELTAGSKIYFTVTIKDNNWAESGWTAAADSTTTPPNPNPNPAVLPGD